MAIPVRMPITDRRAILIRDKDTVLSARIRALIVDDEPIARKILREELEVIDAIEVAGEADSGESALLQLAAVKPDLLFLDIQMPVMDGFEFLDHLTGGHLPAVVMVTAYDQHAIQAFEAGAVDYLLKPISHQRLAQAVDRVKRIIGNPVQTAEMLAHLQGIAPQRTGETTKVRKIVGKLGEEYFLLNPGDVLAFQADGDATWILTANQRFAATQNLRAIEERLGNSSFRRIHRNAMVNVEQIRKMSMITSQRWLVTLNNGQEFIVSKRQARHVRDVLNW